MEADLANAGAQNAFSAESWVTGVVKDIIADHDAALAVRSYLHLPA